MGIDVRLETENAEPIGEPLYDQSGRLASALADAKGSQISFIDPYGNTVFNQLQLPVLVKELEAVLSHVAVPSREHLSGVIELLRQGLEKPHVYARFIGD